MTWLWQSQTSSNCDYILKVSARSRQPTFQHRCWRNSQGCEPDYRALDGCLCTGIHSFKDNEKMAMLPQITLYPCSYWGTTKVAAYFEAKQKRRTLGRSELEGNFWGKLQRGVMGGYDNISMNICRKFSDNNERINPSN